MRTKSHRCKQCRRTDDVCGPISRRGLCEGCAIENYRANDHALRTKSGPRWEAIQRRWLESAGVFGRPETPYNDGA